MSSVKKTGPVIPATNLADAYRALEKDLDTPDLFEAYYVERKHSPAGRLKAALETGEEPCKVLYSGQNKSGKTTELLRLARELKESHLVVFLSVKSDMEPSDVKAPDLLLLSLVRLSEQARAAGVKLGRDVERQLADFLLQSMSEVYRTRVTEKSGRGAAGIKLGVAIAELGGSYRIDSTLRTEVRQRLEPRIGDLVELFRFVTSKTRQQLGQEPLVIVDDMEKLDLDDAEALFHRKAGTLTRPDCRMIYTFPKALEYLPSWRTVQTSFDHAVEVYPVRTTDRNGRPHEEGLELLRSILSRRMSRELFTSDAFVDVVTYCNGVLSDLLSLCRNACLTALESKAEQITLPMVERQALELTINYRRMIDAELYPVLEEVAKSRATSKNEQLSRLLHMLAVIEYRDEEGIYYDVHPAVRRLLKPRKPA